MRTLVRLSVLAAALCIFLQSAFAGTIETKSILLDLPPGWTEQPGPTISATTPTGAKLMLSILSSASATSASVDEVEKAAVGLLRRTIASPALTIDFGPSEHHPNSSSRVTEARAHSTKDDYAIVIVVVRAERAVLLATIEGTRSNESDLLAAKRAVTSVRWK